jgi:hypothetical protein
MGKFPKENVWQAIACLACTVVLWLHLDDFGASEFSGGRLTGPLFRMADLGSLLFLLALLLTYSSTNCGHNRPCVDSALFSVLPLCLDARTIPTDIQRRILRPTQPTISLGQLGGCWST